MRRARAIGFTALLGLVAWSLAGRGLVNYDTLYALVWGRDLAHGHSPDLSVPLAPTQHPLADAVGVLLSPLGDGATTAALVIAFVALGALGWVVFRLGAAWFNPAAGVLAAAIVLTRRPVLDFGARAYVDIPYLVLVLAALLAETRRRRAGAPVLALLAVAGLLRPEAWLLTVAYLGWLSIGGVRAARLLAIAAAGPVLWALSDLLLTGDPLHSLLGTRDTAAELARVTGLQNVPLTMPRRLGEILREPVLVGAAGGGVLALWLLRRRAALGAVTGVVAVGAFCVLATAGLPILGRYLLLPAAILAIFCGRAPSAGPSCRAAIRGGGAGPGSERSCWRCSSSSPPPRPIGSARCATRWRARTRSSATCTRWRPRWAARPSPCRTTARCRCWRCG